MTHATCDPIAEQAAQWIVLLGDDDDAGREHLRREFEDWKQADPRHAVAAAEMEQLISRVQRVRDPAAGNARPARAALDTIFRPARNRQRTRRIGSILVLLLTLVAPAWLALQVWPVASLTADLRTSAGEWQTHTLADGTQLTLGSAGAVNLRYDEHRRAVELVRGAILVDVAHDAARPFVVETRHGSIRALGTRFVVEQQDEATVLSMIESRVAVQTAAQRARHSDESVEVSAGQRVRITASTVSAAESVDTRSLADAWHHHQLVIDDQPLTEVLEQLSRHRPGHVFYDPARTDRIRVSAVLPLDDTDRALQLLVDNFPALRVRMLSPYLVWVDAPLEN